MLAVRARAEVEQSVLRPTAEVDPFLGPRNGESETVAFAFCSRLLWWWLISLRSSIAKASVPLKAGAVKPRAGGPGQEGGRGALRLRTQDILCRIGGLDVGGEQCSSMIRIGAAHCVPWPVAELAERFAQRLADHPERRRHRRCDAQKQFVNYSDATPVPAPWPSLLSADDRRPPSRAAASQAFDSAARNWRRYSRLAGVTGIRSDAWGRRGPGGGWFRSHTTRTMDRLTFDLVDGTAVFINSPRFVSTPAALQPGSNGFRIDQVEHAAYVNRTLDARIS